MKRLGLAGLAVVAACGHSRQVEKPPPEAPVQLESEAGVPVAATPEGIVPPEALERLQEALWERGFAVAITGELDLATEAALRRFQRSAGLAETGLPNLETLERLGLDAQEIYEGEDTP